MISVSLCFKNWKNTETQRSQRILGLGYAIRLMRFASRQGTLALKVAPPTRRGHRISGRGGHPQVVGACCRYAIWLRTQFEFPVRVPVYFSSRRRIVTSNGETVTASFFAPFDRSVEPYTRIATGDYEELERELGRDNALASMLCSFSHEVIHYQQWVNTGTTTERSVIVKARNLVDRYAETTDHP